MLGPTLFSIYINELLFINTQSKIISYADDTVLLVDGDNWEQVTGLLVIEFSKIQQWLAENLLTLNLDKTKFMCFSIYNKFLPNFQTINLHTFSCISNNYLNCHCTQVLQSTVTMKYLGITIDQNLKWIEHIKYLNNKIRKIIWKFYQLRNILPAPILKTVYYALAELVLRYGISIWGGAFPSNLEMLKITQKYLIKIILFKNKNIRDTVPVSIGESTFSR